MNENPESSNRVPVAGLAVDACSGSSRAARKQAADERRRAWRIRWVDIGKREVQSGKTVRDALLAVANDVADMMTANPTQRSEINRAFEEWLTAMRNVTHAMRELSSPNK